MSVKHWPEIIAISETKLKDQNINNISIPGYSFVNTNSHSAAGGVGMYIANDIDFIVRQDLSHSNADFESCWIEINRIKHKNILIGTFYRHPSGNYDHFEQILKEHLASLNSKQKEVFLLGDFNINLLNYNNDHKTAQFLDGLLDEGFMQLITKPTRVTDHTSTLIDHIFTNIPQKILNSGILFSRYLLTYFLFPD